MTSVFMMVGIASVACAAVAAGQGTAHTFDSREWQIAAAVSPLPKSLRAGAAVFGYDSTGAFVPLRKGTNDLICLADDPKAKRFHVSCYYSALEPFMARGRELRKHMTSEQADSMRATEIRSGRLAMPRGPTALYQYIAPRDSVDVVAGAVRAASFLYVVYIPFATTATTGATTDPLTNGGPWLMYPGKPWAHLMIAPTRTETITLAN